MELEEIVALSVKHNVSDLHLCNASAPRWRRQGKLEPAPLPLRILARYSLIGSTPSSSPSGRPADRSISRWLRPAAAPARQRICPQPRSVAGLRLLAETCPQLADLGAPAALTELLNEESGLILVTGATGSGKSTTLAAMVGYLNQRLNGHILTLEDPVEFIHRSERCLIQQREIGRHCPSFAAALRAALRQDPDVILLGELRDSETIRLALTAAETGHLVMATLHTRGAAQAVERLVDVFPAQEKEQVRSQLAGSLCAVLAQKLFPDTAGGRVALYELLVNTPAVANLIREGKRISCPA
jgi:twitching motility protein PilT